MARKCSIGSELFIPLMMSSRVKLACQENHIQVSHSAFVRRKDRTKEVARRAKALAAKSDDLGLMPAVKRLTLANGPDTGHGYPLTHSK